MFSVQSDGDTICAPSTPSGVGGISVIRVSGSKASTIARAVAPRFPELPESHRAYFAVVKDQNLEPIDECVLTYFEKGRSFTGETTVEISSHGSPFIVSDLMRALVAAGARPADKGEFTYRAYINGRIDLTQAESVLALIESRSSLAARVALRQLQGGLKMSLTALEDRLTWCLAHLEASIDFSTEDIEVVSQDLLLSTCRDLKKLTNTLLESFAAGRVAREGLKVALVGEANVGKSSLLNRLLEEERALVTPVAGTTRDVVEGRLVIGKIPVSLLDTAGIRETEDLVEGLGIKRTYGVIRESDVVLCVFDAREGLSDQVLEKIYSELNGNLILIANKTDLLSASPPDTSNLTIRGKELQVFNVSAVSGKGIQELRDTLLSRFAPDAEDSSFIFIARHHALLKKVYECLNRAEETIAQGYSPELSALEFQESLFAVYEIMGKRVDEQIIDRIFKEFCLGK